MLLVSLAACIGFENRYLAGVLLFADRIHRQHTRFGAQGDFAHFSCVFHILVKILRVNLYFDNRTMPSALIGSLAHIPGCLSRFRHLPMISPVAR